MLVSRLRELVEGKVVILRVSRLQNREELIRRFPVLARLGEGIAQNYVACYVDVANAEKKWVTDILVEEGWQVHKFYCPFPAIIGGLFPFRRRIGLARFGPGFSCFRFSRVGAGSCQSRDQPQRRLVLFH